MTSLLVNMAIFVFGIFVLGAFLARMYTLPLPPGPSKIPIIGNLLDMPSSYDWLTFAEWGKKWGGIVSISIFSQQIIVLNSVHHAIEILDKKSAVYSDRPIMQMGGELVGWKNTLVLLPYGNRFRNFRKLFHNAIGSQAAAMRFQPVQEIESLHFLKRILESPRELLAHIRRSTGAVILRISHGYEVKGENDPYVTVAGQALEQFSLSTAPGGFLVNLVPQLRYVPAWMPGAGFKKIATSWAQTLNTMVDMPYEYVKKQIAAGTAEVSFTFQLLESNTTAEEEEDIKWSAGSLYGGGADTTVAATYAMFLACALNPKAVQKVQKELDDVIGNTRLPGFADRKNLPYTNAFVLEVFRWHATVTTAPHATKEDNMYEGYFIPKGALIIANIWYMLHDPNVYPDPFSFKPERFLGPQPQRDPRDICFGFGRRICPGRELAEASVFITTVMSLAVFDITKSVVDGVVVEPKVEQTTGLISHPKPFLCSIAPRSLKL
ncbi:cytochrome P450 [Gymnopilus junonius]|uniref:Cytochrome P450 n=1 Tax=Gymnopilus junonius TaxID=109634 RepID=A0A9P5TKM7_GYMJU|nr:cytochrome P450 [Gymnopilus junonius]